MRLPVLATILLAVVVDQEQQAQLQPGHPLRLVMAAMEQRLPFLALLLPTRAAAAVELMLEAALPTLVPVELVAVGKADLAVFLEKVLQTLFINTQRLVQQTRAAAAAAVLTLPTAKMAGLALLLSAIPGHRNSLAEL